MNKLGWKPFANSTSVVCVSQQQPGSVPVIIPLEFQSEVPATAKLYHGSTSCEYGSLSVPNSPDAFIASYAGETIKVSYTPNPEVQNAEDHFSFYVVDANGRSVNEAVVTVQVILSNQNFHTFTHTLPARAYVPNPATGSSDPVDYEVECKTTYTWANPRIGNSLCQASTTAVPAGADYVDYKGNTAHADGDVIRCDVTVPNTLPSQWEDIPRVAVDHLDKIVLPGNTVVSARTVFTSPYGMTELPLLPIEFFEKGDEARYGYDTPPEPEDVFWISGDSDYQWTDYEYAVGGNNITYELSPRGNVVDAHPQAQCTYRMVAGFNRRPFSALGSDLYTNPALMPEGCDEWYVVGTTGDLEQPITPTPSLKFLTQFFTNTVISSEFLPSEYTLEYGSAMQFVPVVYSSVGEEQRNYYNDDYPFSIIGPDGYGIGLLETQGGFITSTGELYQGISEVYVLKYTPKEGFIGTDVVEFTAAPTGEFAATSSVSSASITFNVKPPTIHVSNSDASAAKKRSQTKQGLVKDVIHIPSF